MPEGQIFTVNLPPGQEIFHHSSKTHRALELRIRRAMHYGGYKDFSAFALNAYATQCRKIELEHGIDANGNPVR
jgi:hypothetical protein